MTGVEEILMQLRSLPALLLSALAIIAADLAAEPIGPALHSERRSIRAFSAKAKLYAMVSEITNTISRLRFR